MPKGNYVDIYEKYHIYKHNTAGECLNEQHNAGSNVLSHVLLDQCRKVGTSAKHNEAV
jgi:hypothetical protein